MKPVITAFFCIVLFIGSYGQVSNLVLFTEGGEKFTLYINGVKQNRIPEANVKATGIKAEGIQLKVLFEMPGAPELVTPMMVEAGMEMTAVITKNKKGKYVFKPVGMVPVGESQTNTETVTIRNTASPASLPASTTVERTSVTPANNASVNVNVSDTESNVKVNLQVNVNEPAYQQTVTTSQSQAVYREPEAVSHSRNDRPVIEDGCTRPMTPVDFENAKKAIANKSFADEKMTICKQIIKGNCVSVKQVVGLMELFTYEDNKLQVAKLAYPKTVDKSSYYQVNDAFTYSASVDDLNKFLENQE